jgi:hypothetical protein
MPKGISCTVSSSPNAVKVTQTATVPNYFLRVVGIKSVTMSSNGAGGNAGGVAAVECGDYP